MCESKRVGTDHAHSDGHAQLVALQAAGPQELELPAQIENNRSMWFYYCLKNDLKPTYLQL